MEQRGLRDALQRLHGELRRVETVDQASKDALRDLLHDIEGILGRSEEDPSERHRTLLDRLKESTEHFEASHPDLTAAMERAINALSNMGI